MDLTMDIQNELELQFLDLNGLNDDAKGKLIDILKSKVNEATLKLPWDSETMCNVSASASEIPQVQEQWYPNAVQLPPTYTMQQHVVCENWQAPPVYPAETHIQPFVPAMTYTPQQYNLAAEVHDVGSNRENNRRNNRGQGVRRDNFNHGMNPNELQQGYMRDQMQFQASPMSFVVMYPDHYSQLALYPSNVHTHTNTYPHTQPPYGFPPYQPSGNIRNIRQPAPAVPQPNQECTKVQTPKIHGKRMQNIYTSAKQSFHQANEENNSSQTNITTIVTLDNNKVEQCTDKTVENTANKKNSHTNGKVSPVNAKKQHNIVSSVKENCNGTEKNDEFCVNLNSNTEVKQNGETDKDVKNETISGVKTPSNFVINTPTPAAPSPALPSMSWASVLKKGSAEPQLNLSNYKQIERINSLTNADNAIPKTQSTGKNEPSNNLISSNFQNAAGNKSPLSPGSMQHRYADPIAYRIGEFLSTYQMDKQTVSLIPRGLTNKSNYCYINSILQALLACPPFYNLLMAIENAVTRPTKLSGTSSTPLIDNLIQFVSEFTPLSESARLARKDRNKRGDDTVLDIQSGIALEASYVYSMLKHSSAAGVFPVEGRQEDAEEFLSCLLNGVNDEMLDVIKLISEQNATHVENFNYNNGEEEWKVMGPKNKGSITRCTEFGRTPLSDIFRGQLRSRVSRAGDHATENVQPFFTLQLDIEKAESVKDALEILVGKDQLEGMTCSRTKQKIEAWKQVTLEELPVILILHLKWFDYKLDGCSKIVKSVEFPIDLRLEGKFLSPNKKFTSKQRQYKLFAVTYHDGKEATKGHYVTDAFHVGYGSWVRYDDSSVKAVSESNVLNPAPPRVPYLLYYRRCDTIGNNQHNNAKTR